MGAPRIGAVLRGSLERTLRGHRTCAAGCAIDLTIFETDNACMNMVFRSLVLASTALFVLPPGWCCFVPLGKAVAELCAPEAPAFASVNACCHRPISLPVQPAQEPRPVPANADCCCSDRMVAEPDSTITFDRDVTVVCWLVAFAPLCNEAHEEVVVSERQPLPLALHILHCVWLC
jgi:hypothetical protein